ncbi:hypothetical protein DNTS_031220 [Danionella cerebrum]|uniref:Secreted protein n=1 Tax=Danionella cerebrum TaxID=2873325 RepID=A0A553MND6_9TELE|nr:hypothetical protein DNTS_031220 [Danionella translucida]
MGDQGYSIVVILLSFTWETGVRTLDGAYNNMNAMVAPCRLHPAACPLPPAPCRPTVLAPPCRSICVVMSVPQLSKQHPEQQRHQQKQECEDAKVHTQIRTPADAQRQRGGGD